MNEKSKLIQNISIYEIISFILLRWRTLIIFLTCGCLAGFFYSLFFISWTGSYKIILPYSKSPMNMVEFKKFQRYVPVILSQSDHSDSKDRLHSSLNRIFYSTEYWLNDVKANTVLSKIDVKEMTLTDASIDDASSYLSSIEFTSKMPNKHDAEETSKIAANIFIKAGSFFKLKSFIETFSLEVKASELSANAQISNSKNFIKILSEYLVKGDPKSDLKSNTSNVMSPLISRYEKEVIVLAGKEIEVRGNNSLAVILPKLEKAINYGDFDGIALGKEMLSIIQHHKEIMKFKAGSPESAVIENLESEISLITFSAELIINSPFVVDLTKKSFLISTAIGGSLGLFLALMLLTIILIARNHYSTNLIRNSL